jgi:hypothetical protein
MVEFCISSIVEISPHTTIRGIGSKLEDEATRIRTGLPLPKGIVIRQKQAGSRVWNNTWDSGVVSKAELLGPESRVGSREFPHTNYTTTKAGAV